MSNQITQQFSQSLFQIQTRTRTRRHCGGGRPRLLTKALQPPSQCPRGTDRTHREPDVVPTSDWCECGRCVRQGPDQVCFFSFSGSNPRWTNYGHMPTQSRAGARPWGPTVKQDTSGTILLWALQTYVTKQVTETSILKHHKQVYWWNITSV